MESIGFTYTRGERWRYLWWDERNATILVAPSLLCVLFFLGQLTDGIESASGTAILPFVAYMFMPFVISPLLSHFRYSLRSAESIVVDFSTTEITVAYRDETIHAHRIVNLTQMGKSVVFITPTGVSVLIPKRAFADKNQLERFLIVARKLNSVFSPRPRPVS